MHFTTQKLQRQFIKSQHALRQTGEIPTVESYVAQNKTTLQYQRDLNSLVQSAPLASDGDRAAILARCFLRAQKLREHARAQTDMPLSEEANRLMHRISSFVQRRTESAWHLVELTAEKIKHFHAELRDAFENELAKVQDEEFVSFEDFLAKHHSVQDYAELIYKHLKEAESSEDTQEVLHELAQALLQMDSLRQYAHHKHYSRLEAIMQRLESSILLFIDSDSEEIWNQIVVGMADLRSKLGTKSVTT